MKILKVIAKGALFVVIALGVVVLATFALTGLAIGAWVAMHWNLTVDGWGFWAIIGGLVLQFLAMGALFGIGDLWDKDRSTTH